MTKTFSKLAPAAGCCVLISLFGSGCTRTSPPVHTVNRVATPTVEEQVPIATEPDSRQAQTQPRLVSMTSASSRKDAVHVTADVPEKITAGESYDYTIRVTNNSESQAAHDVRLFQKLAKGQTIESSKPDMHDSSDKQHGSWHFAALQPGETKTITVTASADEEGDLQQCFTVTYSPAFCFSTKVVKPDLRVAKIMPSRSSICDPIAVHYKVVNEGSGAANNVTITDELPEGLTTHDGKQNLSFEVESLDPGMARMFEVQLVASQTGELGSRAHAKTSSGQEARSNYVATEFLAPDLKVNVTGPDVEYIHRPMTYTVTLANEGKAPAYETRLFIDTAAARLIGTGRMSRTSSKSSQGSESSASNSSTSGSGQTAAQSDDSQKPHASADQESEVVGIVTAEREVAFDVGNVAPGETVTVRLTLVAHSGAELAIRAVATMACPAKTEEDRFTASTQTRIVALPALLVATVDEIDPVQVGKEVNYTILVQNQGDAADQDIRITATLPEHLEYVSSDGVTKAEASGRELKFAPVEKLHAGDQVTWHVKAKAVSEGQARFTVELTSSSQDKPATTEEPTRIFKLSAGDQQQSGSQSSASENQSESGQSESANSQSAKSQSAKSQSAKSAKSSKGTSQSAQSEQSSGTNADKSASQKSASQRSQPQNAESRKEESASDGSGETKTSKR